MHTAIASFPALALVPQPTQSAGAPHRPSPRLYLTFLGRMQVHDETGRSLLPRVRKTRAVLAVLAMAAPDPVPRDRLTALLWSSRGREQALGSLRQCVRELQALLHPLGADLFRADRNYLVLSREAIRLDLPPREPALRPRHFLEDLAGLDRAFDAWLAEQAGQVWREAAAPEPPVGQGARLGVLPFRALARREDDALALGLAEEITTALSRFRSIVVIASMSLAALAGEPLQGPRWRELCLNFLLTGTVRRGRDRVRVTVQLLDLRAGGEIAWAGQFDRDAADVLTLQDDIAAATVAQVDPELLAREGRHAAARPASNVTAYDLVLRAIPAIYRLERASFDAAGALLAEAVALDPDYAAAHAWWACWHLFQVGQGWAADPDAAMQRAGQLADRAIVLDPSDARGLTIAGHVRAFLHHRVDEAMALHERALSLNPNLPLAWALSGIARTYAGQYDDAIRRIRRARELSPHDPHTFFFIMALMMPHFLRGDFEVVVALGYQALDLNRELTSTYKGLLAALGHLGRGPEAAVLAARLLLLDPAFHIADTVARTPLARREDADLYAEGLRRAGLPP